ncbi:Smad nuclear-interacting protein 1 [Blastocladiella emersonii ATCC 22665]|nr:Smad nuclear-interacting protein 1 [Blastocladiella emersonii ATCC 22665]
MGAIRAGSWRGADRGNGSRTPSGSPPAQPPPVVKPNFGLSGKLAEDANKVEGTAVVLKYTEPLEARVPTLPWVFVVFKAKECLATLQLHAQSCYMFGRDRIVADVVVEHPSCSKQHAVLQFRQVTVKTDDGDRVQEVKPYLLDINSTNGTFLNGERIDSARYYEVREKDIITFGQSTREYVAMVCRD